MPFYSWLKPRSGESKSSLQTKRRASTKLRALREALDRHIEGADVTGDSTPPANSAAYVRIATWNLREFDSASYGYRSQEAKAYIAEIISRFDLIALQEIRRDLDALNDIKYLLGPNWDYVATDVTEGSAGNHERMAYLFNRDKVWFRDVAGELTLPDGQKVTDPFGERFQVAGGVQLELPDGQRIVSPQGLRNATLASGQTKIEEDVEIAVPEGAKMVLPAGTTIRFADNARVPVNAQGGIEIEDSTRPRLPEAAEIVLPPHSLRGGSQQFARTPYVAAFQAGWLKINLATVHIYYGSGDVGVQRRAEEIRRLTALLADRARSDSDSDADAYFVALGDFNIVGPGHITMDALNSNDFTIPEPLQSLKGTNVKQDKFYDQIALWTGASKRRKSYTRLHSYRAGVFDFFDVVYRSDEEDIYRPFMRKPDGSGTYSSYSSWRTHQMSDHLPMWVELRIDFSGEYLSEIEAEIDQKLAQD